jgi:hypothetical protein
VKEDKLFKSHYEPGLVRNNIQNVALRSYTHIQGLATDDPANSTEIIFTPRVEVDARMTSIFQLYGENKGMALTSIVSNMNKQRYLFLLDCGLACSEENEIELTRVLRDSIGVLPALYDGMILRTVNSYHVVGFIPLSLQDWVGHMAQSLLLKTSTGHPIADTRYIGHSLEREYGSLRISDYMNKPTPDFVCNI